jgi:hypothetical protein
VHADGNDMVPETDGKTRNEREGRASATNMMARKIATTKRRALSMPNLASGFDESTTIKPKAMQSAGGGVQKSAPWLLHLDQRTSDP